MLRADRKLMLRRLPVLVALLGALLCAAVATAAAPRSLTPDAAMQVATRAFQKAQATMHADPTPAGVQGAAMTLSNRLRNLSRRTAAGQALTARDVFRRDRVAAYLQDSGTRWAEVGLGSRTADDARALQTESDAEIARALDDAPDPAMDVVSSLVRQLVIGLMACLVGIAAIVGIRRLDTHRRAKAAAYRPAHATTSRHGVLPRRRPRR